jgi:hypothetical protein
MRGKLQELQSMASEKNIPVFALCINFALLNNYIDRVIVGIDDLKNIQDDVGSLRYRNDVSQMYDRLIRLQEDDEHIILPFYWEK